MNPFELRELGESGVRLTQLGFGSAPLGELFVRVDEPTAAATLKAAWDAGIRYYDTAPYYGRGLAEIRCGRFLDPKPRSEFVLSTKVGRWFFPPAKLARRERLGKGAASLWNRKKRTRKWQPRKPSAPPPGTGRRQLSDVVKASACSSPPIRPFSAS
jgi:aryl-alcohol dehydrogenase-like predicted oxidoreductase